MSRQLHPSQSGETEAIVIIKAAPQIGQRHGETVCCAGIDLHGNWLRLFPVSFRTLDDAQKFRRWDRIKFKWRLPSDDQRVESRRVDQQSIEVVGRLKGGERQHFLTNTIVTSLDAERSAGKSLALLKVEVLEFKHVRKPEEVLHAETAEYEAIHAQKDLFGNQPDTPYAPCPYEFKYRYRMDDGEREGKCQDWEVEATYFNWSNMYGELEALNQMHQVFGKDYPKRGMLLAMGTHSRWPDTWLINGVIRLDPIKQTSLL